MKYFYGSTKREAKNKLDEYLALTRAGQERSVMTLESYITNWLENVKIHELKPRSYDTLESTVNTHIIPRIGFYGLSDLTSDIIQKELINNLVKTSKSFSTVKKTFDALNSCLKFAAANQIILYNPMQTVVKPSRTRYETKEIEILTDDEITALCSTAENYGRYGAAIILILYTGVRSAEALGLKWNDFSEENRLLTIDGSLVMTKNRDKKEEQPNYRPLEQSTSKTKKSTRKIYLTGSAINALQKLKKQNYRDDEKDYIICNEKHKPLNPRNLQRAFDGVLKKSNIPHKGLHALRHPYVKPELKNIL